jgi:hypothetical protein
MSNLLNRVRFMVFNTTFNNISDISWRSVLLVEESGAPGENHRHTLSHNVVCPSLRLTIHFTYEFQLYTVPKIILFDISKSYYNRDYLGVQQYFSYIVAVSFIGGGKRSTRRKPSTYFIT